MKIHLLVAYVVLLLKSICGLQHPSEILLKPTNATAMCFPPISHKKPRGPRSNPATGIMRTHKILWTWAGCGVRHQFHYCRIVHINVHPVSRRTPLNPPCTCSPYINRWCAGWRNIDIIWYKYKSLSGAFVHLNHLYHTSPNEKSFPSMVIPLSHSKFLQNQSLVSITLWHCSLSNTDTWTGLEPQQPQQHCNS